MQCKRHNNQAACNVCESRKVSPEKRFQFLAIPKVNLSKAYKVIPAMNAIE